MLSVVFNNVNSFRGIQLNHGRWVTDLEFADGIAVLDKGTSTVQLVLDRTVCETTSVSLWINVSKSNFFPALRDAIYPIHIHGETLK